MAQTKAGSPVYCAPEVLREEDYNEKADIWSLGCVIYELCCVEYAYSSINEKFLLISMMQQKRKPIPSCYSRDLAEVIERMLQVDFKKRPSATELLAHPKFKEYNLTRASNKSPALAAARISGPSSKPRPLATLLPRHLNRVLLLPRMLRPSVVFLAHRSGHPSVNRTVWLQSSCTALARSYRYHTYRSYQCQQGRP